MKYIVKVSYIPSLELYSFYECETREEAESIVESCLRAEIEEVAEG